MKRFITFIMEVSGEGKAGFLKQVANALKMQRRGTGPGFIEVGLEGGQGESLCSLAGTSVIDSLAKVNAEHPDVKPNG